MKKSFQNRIEELRAGRTQKEFAKVLGVPLNTYTNWTRGIRVPASDAIVSICTQMSVSADWLLGLSDATSPSVRAAGVAKQEPQPDAYWRDLVANQQATITELTHIVAQGRRVVEPAAVGGRAVTKTA